MLSSGADRAVLLSISLLYPPCLKACGEVGLCFEMWYHGLRLMNPNKERASHEQGNDCPVAEDVGNVTLLSPEEERSGPWTELVLFLHRITVTQQPWFSLYHLFLSELWTSRPQERTVLQSNNGGTYVGSFSTGKELNRSSPYNPSSWISRRINGRW